MKTRILKKLSLLLALLILFSLVACNDTQNNEISSQTETSDSVGTVNTEFLPNVAFKIIRGNLYTSDDNISDASEYLQNAFSAVYGIQPKITSDTSIGFMEPGDYEIIIGDSNRPQSAQLMQSFGLNDYSYVVESDKTIVICGGSPAATYEGVKKFCSDVLGYNGTTAEANRIIKIGATYTYRDSYVFATSTLNGILLNEYTIAVASLDNMEVAIELAMALGQYSGAIIPIISFEELTGNEKALIYVGATDRTGTSNLMTTGYTIHTYTDEIGSVLCLASTNKYTEAALESLLDRIETEVGDADDINLSIAEDYYTYYGFIDDITQWVQDSETTTEIADGVTLIEKVYHDENNLPYRTYALIIDPDKNRLYMGSTADGYNYSLEFYDKENVQEHMEAAVNNGLNVLAGVNADFFAISGDYHPEGLAIKEGQQISTSIANRPFFGVTYDGEVIISTGSQYSSALNLRTAVGGSDILVRNGAPYSIGDTSNNYGTIQPHTMAGVREDGSYVLAVIDGRQETISNGATLARCALVMMDLGCTDAINLDGGGSTTLITRDSATDEYTVQNNPSGVTLRDVYNSLLVVQIENSQQ